MIRSEQMPVEGDPGMRRLGLGDTPVMVATIVLGSLLMLWLLRSGFRGVVVKVG